MKKSVKKATKHKRPSWDEYFLDIVNVVGSRATCDKGGSGCVITHDNRIVSTGYTGSLSGLPHCNEVGHDIKSDQCLRTIHAEHNAISQALKFGVPLDNTTMYCKIAPCPACAKMAASLGIKKVVVEEK
ncbi:MAG: Cytidine and deoxycytidylate deaminase zinc-binding region [Candidatus Nomurabacteria bacterium GW2011_GWA2_41_25]|uniref:CMP/dCMP-type deaminase domain-containing protein n=2 Tax=Candidatus Nomuraibacteriota TaxID=1752729 RepID=A0A1F6YA27_9BACT|nr:MAG: Cytidine and deoxycytidylate deaminase zinc-binding region [Candidatus Nomurabacteria bacterium GW2011_GWA2_41_25]OGI67171.1 MAG: hypothetical protein A2823_01955 [Candidatus Nomurabacteria bacterium RIFCSPHIGHO2_01_FULL_41_91]OGI80300.1 MAG: hypothetical protein A3D43_01340 [Candidatus Nomurabacteria bacterium RIFCSPHIGHO2_02_FULL_41_52]OGI84966.1 MAG: hypothetical protein A3F49_00435 [Candidatus Nomurabacteria bacterium RIFCSPHIGHO2_12_FULL_42_19]OGI94198.1 MAG: hypothetical protein A